MIDNFMQLRMNLASCSTPAGALLRTADFQSKLQKTETADPFTDEERLILDNFIILEKYNYMREQDKNNPEIKNMMLSQNKKNDTWFTTHTGNTPNKWLYCTAADVISCCLPYIPVSSAMKKGFTIKNYYEEALRQDPGLSYALTNIAQWYYYAPSFGGGSKTKARHYFELALTDARNEAETYYAKIFLSQYLFDEKDIKQSSLLLSEAASEVPDGRYIAHIQKLNNAGYSLYYYNQHQSEIDRKLS